MDCPRCFEEGALAHRGEPPEARGCAGCQGAWLSVAAARRLIEGPFGALGELPAAATRAAALRCPGCKNVMARRRVAEVEIDVCMDHGVWFDHTEVERVQAAARPRVGAGLATAAIFGTAVVADLATSIYGPPGAGPRPMASNADAGSVIEVAASVGDVGLAAVDIAASGAETVGSAVLDAGAVEVVGAGVEAAGSGALEVLASLFEGLFSL
jgi:hypothetical protein